MGVYMKTKQEALNNQTCLLELSFAAYCVPLCPMLINKVLEEAPAGTSASYVPIS